MRRRQRKKRDRKILDAMASLYHCGTMGLLRASTERGLRGSLARRLVRGETVHYAGVLAIRRRAHHARIVNVVPPDPPRSILGAWIDEAAAVVGEAGK